MILDRLMENSKTNQLSKVIYTNRLRLRPLQLSDKDKLYVLDSNPNVMRFIGSGMTRTPKESAAYFSRAISLTKGNMGYWIAETKESNTFVGCFVLKECDNTSQIELGCRIREEQWGKGFATESSQALIHYGFTVLGLNELVALTLPNNITSSKVLQKLGFTFKKQGYFYGIFADYFINNKTIPNQSTL